MVQEEVKRAIFQVAKIVGIDPAVAMAVSEIESKHGMYQKSKTGARGIFQNTLISMKDLLLKMEESSDDIIDICVGICFLRLLFVRHKDWMTALSKYCDPNDRDWYPAKALKLADEYRKEIIDKYCR
jgi:hypothetical protein